jgi:signal transduction histidine kinase
MTRRVLLSYLSITLLVLVLLEVPLALFYGQRERDRLEADVEHDANVLAGFYEDALEDDATPDPRSATAYAARTDARVVVVNDTGISMVDTERPPRRDFSTRPEIATALNGERAAGTRRSDTLDTEILYVAVPVASGGTVHGAVRVTLDIEAVNARVRRVWIGLAATGLVVLAVVAVIGWALARSVTRPVRALNAAADRFARGDLTTTKPPPGSVPELQDLARTLNTMAVRLDELLAAQRTFVADASHQLRTPLTSMRLRLENLESHIDDPTATAEVEALTQETTRLSAIVTDLLRLAHAEQHPPPVPVDLARLTADRVDTWTATTQARGVDLELHAPRPPVLVTAVPGAVEQILDNLLDNALNASPPGTTITVQITPGHNGHHLRITDQGPGLSPDQKAHAVERFWRAEPTSAGTGLGLSIVHALTTASGGTLTLDDAPNGGLAVTVTLPASPAHHQPARHHGQTAVGGGRLPDTAEIRHSTG